MDDRWDINAVLLDVMNIEDLKKCNRGTVVFYVKEPETPEELTKCIHYAYDNRIGILKISETQIRKLRRIRVEI